MKTLVLLTVALGAVAIGVPAAQTAPTNAQGCAVEHLTNAACQGPDVDTSATGCEINTWVGDASCELTAADGVASAASGSAEAYALVQGTDWHAELQVVIRDKSTGQVLFSGGDSSTIPLAEAQPVPHAGLGFAGPLSPNGGAEVVCEVTGTHSPAGAAGSAAAALSGFGQWNNIFRCSVI